MPFQLRCWCKCWEWVSIRNVKFSSSFCQTYYCVSDISWFDWNITSICHLQACFSRKPCEKAGAPELLCLFMLTNRFLFSYREWASGISLYLFLLSVFMCSWHCLILSEHCQLKWEYATKKMQQKIVGSPEVWCPFKLTTGFFIVISRMNIRIINLSFIPSVFMCSWRFLVISEYCQ